MEKTKVILICAIQVLFSILTTEALQCLSCDHVAEARDCSHLETCGSNAECFVQRFIGSNLKQYYKMGCKESRICATDSNSLLSSSFGKKREQTTVMTSHWYNKRSDTDLLLCLQCCNNVDGCNKDLCGSAPTTMRRCLNCDDVLGWKDCQDIAECSTDELCYVQATPLQINYEIRVKMGCMGHLQCEGIKRAFPQRCVVCCNEADFCNYNACDNYTSPVNTKQTSPPTPSHPTTPTTTTTVATTTTTLATPTKPEFTIHVDGPTTSVTYDTKTSLTCVTAPPALSYKWTFQNGQPLPSGVTGSYHGTTSGGYAGISVLTVPSVNATTAGNYTCTATFTGVVTHSSSFDLKPSPVRPTVNLQKGPVTMNFVLICKTSGYPSPSVTWNFNGDAGQQTLPSGIDVAKNGTTYTLFVYTYDHTNYDGLWSCTAVNGGGVATSAVRVP